MSKQTFVALGVASAIAFATLTISHPLHVLQIALDLLCVSIPFALLSVSNAQLCFEESDTPLCERRYLTVGRSSHHWTAAHHVWQTMKTVFDAKTPADRLDAQIAAMDSRLAALKEIKPALSKLYVALSAEQKKKADEVLTGMGCMM